MRQSAADKQTEQGYRPYAHMGFADLAGSLLSDITALAKQEASEKRRLYMQTALLGGIAALTTLLAAVCLSLSLIAALALVMITPYAAALVAGGWMLATMFAIRQLRLHIATVRSRS